MTYATVGCLQWVPYWGFPTGDTDCNGATVGGLWGLQGKPIPEAWSAPWQGRIAVTLAGVGELLLDDLVERTVAVTKRVAAGA